MDRAEIEALEKAAENNALGLPYAEWQDLMVNCVPSAKGRPMDIPREFTCRCDRINGYRRRARAGLQIFNPDDDLGGVCQTCWETI